MFLTGSYTDVRSDFSAHVPAVLFTYAPSLPSSPLHVHVGVTSGKTFGSSTHTSELLATYYRLDPRVRLLGVALKYWAKVRV